MARREEAPRFSERPYDAFSDNDHRSFGPPLNLADRRHMARANKLVPARFVCAHQARKKGALRNRSRLLRHWFSRQKGGQAKRGTRRFNLRSLPKIGQRREFGSRESAPSNRPHPRTLASTDRRRQLRLAVLPNQRNLKRYVPLFCPPLFCPVDI